MSFSKGQLGRPPKINSLAKPDRRRRAIARENALRPSWDALEARTLLAVTATVAGGTVTFTGTAADSLYLHTTSAGVLQYHDGSTTTYGSTYSGGAAPVLSAQDTTLRVDLGGTVHLAGIGTAGRSLEVDGTSTQAASVDLNVDTGGGNFTLAKFDSIIIGAAGTPATISTRAIAGSTAYTTAPSTANSGALGLSAQNPDPYTPLPSFGTAPTIVVNAGSALLAQGGNGHADGNISVTATNKNYTLDGLSFPTLDAAIRKAVVTLVDGPSSPVLVRGGVIDIEAMSGDVPIVSTDLAAKGDQADDEFASWGQWVGGVLNGLSTLAGELPVINLLTLPVSVNYRNASAAVTVGTGAQIAGSGDVTLGATSTADAEGQAIYSKGTTVGAAVAFTMGVTDAETDVKGGAAVSSTGGRVAILSTATSTATGTAKVSQEPSKTAKANPKQIQLAFAVGVAQETAHATVEPGATVQSAGAVDLKANGTSTNTQIPTAASTVDGKAGAAFAVNVTKNDIKAEADGTLLAGGTAGSVASLSFDPQRDVDFANSAIRAPGSTLATGDPVVYNGRGLARIVDGHTYYAVIPTSPASEVQLADTLADAAAGHFIPFEQFPTLSAGTNTAAITDVDEAAGAVDFAAAPGFADRAAVVYHAVAGRAINGLVDGQTYYAIISATNPGVLKLASTLPATGDGPAIPLNLDLQLAGFRQAIPVVVDPAGGTANSIEFAFDHGFTLGGHFVYQGTEIAGLVDGVTYYAIPVANDTTSIQLAGSYSDAVAGSALTIGTGEQVATLTFDPSVAVDATANTFDLGFNYVMATGTPLGYHGSLGTNIKGLVDGQIYYAIRDSAAPRLLRLTALGASSATDAYNAGVAAYNADYTDAYNAARDAYLALHPGKDADAAAAGTAAADLAAQQSGSIWTASGIDDFRVGAGPLAGTFPVAVDSTAYTVDFGFDGSFSRNLPVVYQGAANGGATINGLTPGTIYDLRVPDRVNHPGVVQFADASGNIRPVSLTSGTSTTASFGALTFGAVSVAANAISFTDPSDPTTPYDLGLAAGDAFTYEAPVGFTDAGIVGLTPGTTYYVILTPTAGVIQLADTSAHAASSTALTLGDLAGTNIQFATPLSPADTRPTVVTQFLGVDTSLPTGATQTLTPWSPAGVTVAANLTTSDNDFAGASIASPAMKEEKGKKASTGSSAVSTWLSSLFNKAGSGGSANPESSKSPGDAVSKDLPGSTGTSPSVSLAGSFVVQVDLNDVRALIGPTAKVESAADFNLTAMLAQASDSSNSASVSRDENGGKRAGALGITFGWSTPHVAARVADGATVDAYGTIAVDAETSYPFDAATTPTAFEQDSLYNASIPSYNPVNFVKGLYGDSQLGLGSDFINNATVATASAEAAGSVSVGGAIQVFVDVNDTEATVGNARINQDLADGGITFRNPGQSVGVTAKTTYETATEVGKFDLDLSAKDFIANAREKGLKSAAKGIVNLYGDTESGAGGKAFGASINVNVLDNTTIAEIGRGAQVEVGPAGRLDVDATQQIIDVALTQSGDAGGDVGFAGTANWFNLGSLTRAQIDDGVTVNAGLDNKGLPIASGAVDVEAADNTIIVGVTGGAVKSNHIGVGFSASVNNVSRTTLALIGSTSTPTTPGAFDVGSLRVNASTGGMVVGLAYAAVSISPSEGQKSTGTGNGGDTSDGEVALPGSEFEGSSPDPGKSGIAVAGDASVDFIKADTEASINDAGRFNTGNVAAKTINLGGQHPTVIPIDFSASNDTGGLATGTPVTYTSTSPLTGLTSGHLYYAIAVDPGHIELATTAENALAGTATTLAGNTTADQVLSTPNGSTLTFHAADILSTVLDIVSTAGLRTGTPLVYASTSTAVGGLTSGTTYYAIVLDGRRIELADSYADALAGTALAMDFTKGNGTQSLTAGSLAVNAATLTRIVSIAGALSVSKQSSGQSNTGVAGSFSADIVDDTTRAFIKAATIHAGSLSVTADHAGFIGSLTAAAAGATGDNGNAGAGSVSVDTILTDTEAYLSGVTATLAASSAVAATESADIYSLAGALAFGGKGGYGIAVAANLLGAPGTPVKTLAHVDNSTITIGTGTLSVTAVDSSPNGSPRIVSAAGALGIATGQSSNAAAGMIAANFIVSETEAYLQGSTVQQPTAGNGIASLVVHAEDDSWIVDLGGAVGASQKAGVGAAIAYNQIGDSTIAAVDASTVTLKGGATVTAVDAAIIAGATLGLGISVGSGGFAGAGSATVNLINDTTDAHVSTAAAPDSTTPTDTATSISVAGPIVVTAADSSLIASIAGGVAIAANGPGVGAAIGYNEIGDTTTAYVDHAAVTSTDSGVTVGASASGTVLAMDLGLAVSGTSAAINGAISVNVVDDSVDAHVADGSTIAAAAPVAVTATQGSSILSIAGGAAVSGGAAAVGAAIAFNSIGGLFDPSHPTVAPTEGTPPHVNGTTAYIDSSAVATTGSLTVHAGMAAPIAPNTLNALSVESIALPKISGQIFSVTVDGSGGDSFALGAAVSINFIRDAEDAHISGSTATNPVHADGPILVSADDSAAIYSTAGGFSVSGSAAVGGAISTDDIGDKTAAHITNAYVTSGSAQASTAAPAVGVVAGSTSTIANATVGGAGGSSLAISGSISYNRIHNTVDAHIDGGSTVTAPGTINVAASDEPVMAILAGAVAIGGNVGVAAAVAANIIADTSKAYVDASTVQSAAADLDVTSRFQAPATLAALFNGQGGTPVPGLVDGSTYYIVPDPASSRKFGLAASLADATAGILIPISALSTSQMQLLSGASFDASSIAGNEVVFTKAPGFKLGAAVYYHDSQIPKYEINALAIGGGLAGTAAVAGSASLNWVTNDVEAFISNVGPTQTVTAAAGAINVLATDAAGIHAAAGTVAGGGTAAVGASISYNYIGGDPSSPTSGARNKTLAFLLDDAGTVAATQLTVAAAETSTIDDFSVAGTAAGTAAIGGSVSINFLRDDVEAFLAGDANVQGSGGVSVTAVDPASIESFAGALSAAGVVAVGVGAAYNDVANVLKAYIGVDPAGTVGNQANASATVGSNVTSGGGDVVARATSSSTIMAQAVGITASGTASAAGSAAINTIGDAVSAFIDDGGLAVDAHGNVLVVADSTDAIHAFGGSVAVSGLAALGGTALVDLLSTTTVAYVRNANVHARALGNAVPIENWVNGVEQDETIQGLGVVASNTVVVSSIGIAADIAIPDGVSVSFGLDVAVNIVADTTHAEIAAATVNDASNRGRNVAVRAHQSTTVGDSGGLLGVGDVAAGATIDTDILKSGTTADVTRSTISAGAGGVEVEALTDETIASTVVGAAAATYAAAGGSASGLKVAGSARAYVGDSSTIVATGNIAVDAHDLVNVTPIDGFLSGGGLVGAAGSVAVVLIGDTTTADITNSGTDAGGTTNVEADSAETVGTKVVTGAVGGVGSLGISGSVVFLTGSTAAGINASKVNQSTSLNLGGQDVTVHANDVATDTEALGAVSVGLIGGGIGASLDLIVVDDAVDAHIDNSHVDAPSGKVDVDATGDKELTAIVVAAAGGSTFAVDGAVSLIAVGTALGGGALGEISGTISAGINSLVDDSSGIAGLNTGGGSASIPDDKGGSSAVNNGTASNAQLGSRSVGQGINGATGAKPSPLQAAETSGGRVSNDVSAIGKAFSAANDNGTAPKEVTAYIADNSAVFGVTGLTVKAADTVHLRVLVGSAGVSGSVSIGGSVGLVAVGDTTQAFVGRGSTVGAGPLATILVEADGIDAPLSGKPSVEADAGQLGGAVGLGAQVAEVDDTSVQHALLGKLGASSSSDLATISRGSSLSVQADGTHTLDAEATGLTVGAFAAGAAVAEASSQGKTTADAGVQANAIGSVSVTSHSIDNVRAVSTGVSGGIGAFSGNSAAAAIKTTVEASIARQSKVVASGSIGVSAGEVPTSYAKSTGVAVGAVGLGISLATADNAPVVSAAVDDQANLAGSSLSVGATQTPVDPNTPTADGEAVAGTGGILVGANGTSAESSTAGSVEAAVGRDVQLPDGGVTVSADSETSQVANATGVAVGFVGIGASLAKSTSSETTSATLGKVTTHAARAGDLSVLDITHDRNRAKAVAGSGGVVAGDASSGETDDTSTASATTDGGTIHAGQVTVSSTNFDEFAPVADSTNAALAGASGAFARANDAIGSIAKLGDDTTIVAAGQVQVLASQEFNQLDTAAGNVTAGAGGLLNGSAALANISLAGQVGATLGNHVAITSGTDPLGAPGGILVLASTLLSADETVGLVTGGAIQAAAVEADLTAKPSNSAALGIGDTLVSQGNIGVGTYTTAGVQANAGVNTYGLAAVGSAMASTDVESKQTVEVGASSALTAFGNVNLTAGQDPRGLYQTTVAGLASAQGYVTGLIAVPVASATSTTKSDTSLSIDLGATVGSGQNTTVAAYPGTSSPDADGTGHGYELGFIPVTDGSSTPTGSTSSVVTQNGTVTAGIYHELDIEIAAPAVGAAGPFVTSYSINPDGAPYISPAITTDPSFDPAAYLAARLTDPTALQAADSGVAAAPVTALTFGPLYASGGIVTVNADSFGGSGKFISNGSPTVTINNPSGDYLVLGPITIPNLPSGSIAFTGHATAADATAAGIQVLTPGAGGSPTVSIASSYPGSVGSTTDKFGNTVPSQYGPALFLAGAILDLGGLVAITDAAGSLVEVNATVFAARQTTYVPNGVVVIDDNPGIYYAGGDPYTQWEQYQLWPGGDPGPAGSGPPDPAQAIAYLANYEALNSSGSTASSDASSRSFPWDGSELGLNKLLVGSAGDKVDNESAVYLGADTPFLTGPPSHDGSYSTAVSLSPDATAYSITTNHGGKDDGYFPSIPVESLSAYAANFSILDSVPFSSQVYGSVVEIEGHYLDINASITAGTPTDWSVKFAPGLAAVLAAYAANYNHGVAGYSDPVFRFPVSASNAVVAAGDSQVKASYDVRTGKITLDDIRASSSGGRLVLKGNIISTDTLGQIHVNGGLGHVDIENQSGVPLVVQDVYAGSAGADGSVKSSVDIIDFNQPFATTQTLYVYTPGSQVEVFKGPNSATLGNDDNYSLADPSSIKYQPALGYRWAWSLNATLSRTVDLGGSTGIVTASNWRFNTPAGSPNDPWYYTDYTHGGQTTTPTGELVASTDESAFRETITGMSDGNVQQGINYKNSYNFSNVNNQGFTDGRDHWFYDYPTTASLTMHESVRADDPIGISFTGHATGSVVVNSNAEVDLGGTITNPDGTTSITTTSGPIVSLTGATTTSHVLNLTSAAGVGTSAAPVVATLSAGGTLNAFSPGVGVHVNLATGGTIGQVAAGNALTGFGDVVLNANGDLAAAPLAPGQVNVAAGPLTITDAGGSVGAAAAPLRIATSNLGNEGPGILNVSAQGAIHLDQLTGDLLIGQVASTGGGDVSIDDEAGRILDARAQTSAQTLSEAQIQQVWASLHLLDTTYAANSSKVLGNQVTAEYQQYWDLVDNGIVAGSTFTLNASAAHFYTGRAAAAGETVGAYVQGLYNLVTADFVTYLGTNWAGRPEFQRQKTDYQFTTGGFDAALSKNSVYTANQLRYAIRGIALDPLAGHIVGSATPNVVGGSVSLGTPDSVGKLGAPLRVPIGNFAANATMPPEAAAALATATAPGEVTEYGHVIQNGINVPYPKVVFGHEPFGFVLDGVNVGIETPLFVAASQRLAISAGGLLDDLSGGVYIQSTLPDLTLGAIVTQGQVRLSAPHSIDAAADLVANHSAEIDASGAVALDAGSGDLGSAAAPLFVSGGNLNLAAAGGNISLKWAGDLDLGQVFAGGVASLLSTGGIYNQDAIGLPITAKSISLSATGDLGTAANPLSVSTPATGGVSALATGSIFLSGPTIVATSIVSEGGSVNLASTADVDVAFIQSGLNATITAGGSIVDAAPATAFVLDISNEVTLSAGPSGSIGTALVPLTVSGMKLDSATAGGGVSLSWFGNLDVGQVVAGGLAALTATGSILDGTGSTLTNVAGTAVTLASGVAIGDTGGADDLTTSVGSGVLDATAKLGLFLSEAVGALAIKRATTDKGDLRITDSAAGGPGRGHDVTLAAGSSLLALLGKLTIRAGGNIALPAGSVVRGDTVALEGDDLTVGGTGSRIDVDSAPRGRSLIITGGTLGDTLNLQATDANTPVTVDLGGGADLIQVGSLAPAAGGLLGPIAGGVTIAGHGLDVLTVDDTGDSARQSGILTTTLLTGMNLGNHGIAYSGLATLNIRLAAGTPFNVAGTAATTATTVSVAGTAATPISVGTRSTTAGVLAPVLGPLAIQGNGAVALAVDDSLDATPRSATLSAAAIGSFGLTTGSVAFDHIASIALSLGRGAGTLGVSGVAAGVAAGVDAASGGYVVTVSSNPGSPGLGSLSTFLGALTVEGRNAASLVLDDSADRSPAAGEGTLTDTGLAGLDVGPGGIHFADLAALSLSLPTRLSTSLQANIAANLPRSTTVAGNLAATDSFGGVWSQGFAGSLTLVGFATRTLSIAGDLGGSLAATSTGVIQSLAVGGSILPGTVISASRIDTLSVGKDLDAGLTLAGDGNGAALGSGTIGGTLPAGVTLSAASIGSLAVGSSPTTTPGGADLAGAVQTTAGGLGSLSDRYGEIASTSVVTVAGDLTTLTVGPASLSIGQDIAGTVTVGGTLGSATIAGGTPGLFTAAHVGTIAAYGGFGAVVSRIVEAGVARWLEEDAPGQYSSAPNATAKAAAPYLNTEYLYESAGLAAPQVGVSVTDRVGSGPDRLDLSTVAFLDGAKYNLDYLGSVGVSGIGNVAVEGDLIGTVDAAAAASLGLSAGTAGGVALPLDQLAAVSVRDHAPAASIVAQSVQAVAFGSTDGVAAASRLAAGTAIVAPGTSSPQGTETFRVPFGTQPSTLSVGTAGNAFDPRTVTLAIQQNGDGVDPTQTYAASRGADTALIGWSSLAALPGIQDVDIRGDGASLNSLLPIAGTIRGTGPLGDVNVQPASGIDNVTAPSIFGSVSTTGPIYGTVQTTGLRTDPVSGLVTAVSADLGRVYVVPAIGRNGKPYATSTLIGGGGANSLRGKVISRGNLLSGLRSDGGMTGLVASAGDLGAVAKLGTLLPTRVGGLTVNGPFGGQVVVEGSTIGDLTFHGGLVGGRVAVAGRPSFASPGTGSLLRGQSGIVGNLRIDRGGSSYGGIDANSAVVSAGEIGDPGFGTSDLLQDGNAGILAAKGTIAAIPAGGYTFNHAAGANADAIDAIFTDGGLALGIDLSANDQGGLALILADLAALHVGPDGKLTGPKK